MDKLNKILESLRMNEVRTVDIGDGAVAYRSNGKCYIKKGDDKREISQDQFDKLLDQNSTKVSPDYFFKNHSSYFNKDKDDKSTDADKNNADKSSTKKKEVNAIEFRTEVSDIISDYEEEYDSLDEDDYMAQEALTGKLGMKIGNKFDQYLRSTLDDEEYKQSVEYLKNSRGQGANSSDLVRDTLSQILPEDTIDSLDDYGVIDMIASDYYEEK